MNENVAALALFNPANSDPTEFRLYNGMDAVTNWERMAIAWDTNTAYFRTQAGGTGTRRNVMLDGANRAAYNPLATLGDVINIIISHGLMAAS